MRMHNNATANEFVRYQHLTCYSDSKKMYRKRNSVHSLSGAAKAVILIGGPHVGKRSRAEGGCTVGLSVVRL